MTHALLERQLKKITASGGMDQTELLRVVSLTYEEYDRSIRLQHRATQLMSDELNELNAAIRKERDEIVAESQKRFELAVEGTNDGIWDWDVQSDTLWFSARCKTMLGYAPDQLTQCRIADWYGLIQPDDREKAESFIQEQLTGRMRGLMTLQFTHVFGKVRHIMCRVMAVKNSLGRVARFVGVHTDITDLMAMHDELKAARDKAESANHAKSEFLANMSHELRTPMHAILGFSRQALKRTQGVEDEKLPGMLRNIEISGTRLLLLLNALLDLSKLEAGRMHFDFRQDDLRKAIDQTLLELESLLLAKQIRATVQAGDVNTRVPYDYRSMMQVFVNLLSNAIKFSPPVSQITFTLAETSQDGKPYVSCRIRDEGIGIPEGELELIFDKFVQSSKTVSGAGGTGLGLAIARQIIEAHGGRIWAENIPAGGTCMNLLLPREHAV